MSLRDDNNELNKKPNRQPNERLYKQPYKRPNKKLKHKTNNNKATWSSPFFLSPAQTSNEVINYATSYGMKLYTKATKPQKTE